MNKSIPQQNIFSLQEDTIEDTNQSRGLGHAGINYQENLDVIIAEQENHQCVLQTLHTQQENTLHLAAINVANVKKRREELELQKQAQILAQERALQERRIYEKENNLNDLYNDYGSQMAMHYQEDQDRNRQQDSSDISSDSNSELETTSSP